MESNGQNGNRKGQARDGLVKTREGREIPHQILQIKVDSGTPWVTFTLLPFWNAQGNPTYGAFSNGWVDFPYVLLQNQTQCADPSQLTLQRCVTAFWNIGWSAYDQRRGTGQQYSWMVSLLENKRDAVGLDYKRARVYDPQTGRFTQEDPIGLAGGMNAYGFAGSDPVNFSDPLGLRVCFAGPNGRVGGIVRATEQATGTRLTLDKSNCVSEASQVRSTKQKGFEQLQEKFLDLVASGRTVSFIDSPAPQGGGGETDPLTYNVATVDVGLFESSTTGARRTWSRPGPSRRCWNWRFGGIRTGRSRRRR